MVLVSATLEGGGAERQLADMANYWASAGTEVTLTTWSGPDLADFYALDPRVRRVHFRIGLAQTKLGVVAVLFRRIRSLRRLLRELQPDVVISFITATNALTILAAAGLGLNVVVSDRAHPATDVTVTLPWRVLRLLLYRFASVVIAQTRDAAEWTVQHCRKEAVIVPNALRSLLPVVANREKLIVAVGRLDQQKGFDLLLRACASLAERFPEWTVVILGEGPERGPLLALRDALGLGERVNLAGQTKDIETWMARAGLVVQPSRFEGFPNVVLEAMGMGAAVISADCTAGPSDLIQDGVNGRLVPAEDVAALAAAMAELMSQPQTRARLGAEAIKVREAYRQDRIMAQWDSALDFKSTSEAGAITNS